MKNRYSPWLWKRSPAETSDLNARDAEAADGSSAAERKSAEKTFRPPCLATATSVLNWNRVSFDVCASKAPLSSAKMSDGDQS